VVDLKGDRTDKRLTRWREIAINACEQCGRNHLPLIDPISTLPAALAQVNPDAHKWVLHTTAAKAASATAIEKAALVIGPEGGLTEQEVAHCLTSGFATLWLGPRILRTETAAIAALAIMQARYGDM